MPKDEIVTIETVRVATAGGPLFVATRAGRVCALGFGHQAGELKQHLLRRFCRVKFVAEPDPAGIATRLRAWMLGDERALHGVQIDVAGTAFQKRVWSALRRIPAGSTVSYAELARRIGRPSAVRAVASANADNPVSILIPCHRVIGSDGQLRGYGGGLKRKAWLLAHEGARPHGART